MFFLDAGEGVFAVTAGHVYQGYLEAKGIYPATYCQLWNMRFDPAARLIACQSDPETEPDIATFQVTPQEVSRLGKMALTGSQSSWPPAPPEEGKGVFFAGFPSRERLQVSLNEINFGVFQGGLVATSVSERDILCYVEQEHLIDTPWFPGQASVDYDARGVSGAPLISLVDNYGVWSWRLGGVIYKAPEAGGMLFAVRAEYILPDGTLKPFD